MSISKTLRQSFPGFVRFGRHFHHRLRRERRLIFGSFAAMSVEVLLRILEPWPLKFVVDGVLGFGSDSPGRFNSLENLPPVVLLTLASLALVTFAGLRSLTSYGTTVGFALVGNRVLTEVRNDLYRHIQSLSLRYHSTTRKGDLLVRVMGDVGMLKEVTVTALLPLLGNLFVMGGMAAVMLWLNWRLALVLSLCAPVLLLTARSKSKQIQQVARGQRKREAAMATTAAESITGIEAVQALGIGDRFNDAFTQASRRSLKDGVKGKRLAAGLERTVDVVIAIATAVTLWFGARFVLAGELTPGELLVFLSYLKSTFKPVRNSAKYTGRLAKASAAAERVLDVMEIEPEVQDLPGAVPAPSFRGKVEFNNVGFAYDRERSILEKVSFVVEPGARVAIVGASGAGKSTIVGLLLRLFDPSEGTVLIDDEDIRSWTVASVRGQISIVLQDTLLFAASVGENIAYGAPGAGALEIKAAARIACAHSFIEELPEGYDTIVGERGATLSSGQRQRITIARAALRRTPILICDEPTASLDDTNEREVTTALGQLSRGRTTFLITHKLSQVVAADRILYVERGRILEQGTHEQLVGRGGRYASLVSRQDVFVPSVLRGGASFAIK